MAKMDYFHHFLIEGTPYTTPAQHELRQPLRKALQGLRCHNDRSNSADIWHLLEMLIFSIWLHPAVFRHGSGSVPVWIWIRFSFYMQHMLSHPSETVRWKVKTSQLRLGLMEGCANPHISAGSGPCLFTNGSGLKGEVVCAWEGKWCGIFLWIIIKVHLKFGFLVIMVIKVKITCIIKCLTQTPN